MILLKPYHNVLFIKQNHFRKNTKLYLYIINLQQKHQIKINKLQKITLHTIKQMKTFHTQSRRSQKSSPIKSSRINTPLTLSPVRSELYNSLDSDKKHIITKLLYLFTYYSSKISKHSYRELNQKVFILMISELYVGRNHKQLMKNSVEQKQFLGIYYSMRGKTTTSGLRFQQFLQCLPVISIYLCPQLQSRQQAVRQLIHYLITLYDKRISPLITNHIVQYQQPINNSTKELIIKLIPAFEIIYQKLYFNHEYIGKFGHQDLQHESFEGVMKMMKDFEVFPKLLSASQLYLLYHTTLNAQENNLLHQTGEQQGKGQINQQGRLFTLSKMIQFLIACSRICYARLKNLDNPEYDINNQKEIFKTFLEYMQAIKTTKTSSKLVAMFQQHRFTLILLSQYQHQAQKDKVTKTFVLKDKIVKENLNQMEFFGIFDKLHL